jgi:hypothetical protein
LNGGPASIYHRDEREHPCRAARFRGAAKRQLDQSRGAAPALGLTLLVFDVRGPDDIDRVFATAATKRAESVGGTKAFLTERSFPALQPPRYKIEIAHRCVLADPARNFTLSISACEVIDTMRSPHGRAPDTNRTFRGAARQMAMAEITQHAIAVTNPGL